ncbi:MAG: type III-B CRISPR module RAMP protein Cmr6 [bacterium]|nr:type III-B CRISPR module RAMP protein Cmr6 [bacterium]
MNNKFRNNNRNQQNNYTYILGNKKIGEISFISSERERYNSFSNKVNEKINTLKVDSLVLLLSKFIPLYYQENQNSISLDTKIKNSFFYSIIDYFNRNQELINAIKNKEKHMKEIIENLMNQDFILLLNENENVFETSSRLIVGLGSHHILETSLTLDHINGIPFIPSSSIKGSLRALYFQNFLYMLINHINPENTQKLLTDFLKKLQDIFYDSLLFEHINLQNIFNNLFFNQFLNKNELEDIKKYLIKVFLLFGTQDFKGLLIFLDSYPVDTLILDIDIINTHYSEYYTKKDRIPGDWEEPKPIFFLTVAKKNKFKFNILFDSYRAKKITNCLKANDKDCEIVLPKELKDIIRDTLLEILNNDFRDLKKEITEMIRILLKDVGIGAKTRLSYGTFK